MWWLFGISCAVLLLYVAMVALFAYGWRRTSKFIPKKKPSVRVSLIICCRNEERALPALLASINGQTYDNFEVVFANDHSTDQTAEILAQFAENHANVKIISPEKYGKKQALTEAVRCSSGELICCTDADCVLNKNHVALFAEFYERTRADMILGGVRMCSSSWFERLQSLEFASLQASGAGAAGMGAPILANGANMAFTRVAWERVKTNLRSDVPSGDDEFLLLALKKRRAKIRFLRNVSAVVTTRACPTLKEFVAQRARWTSKSVHYDDWQTIAVACVVFFAAVLMLVWGVAVCVVPHFWWAFLVLFFTKFVADSLFLYATLPFFAERKLCRHTFALSLIYPFYVLTSVVKGLLGNVRWKNRTI